MLIRTIAILLLGAVLATGAESADDAGLEDRKLAYDTVDDFLRKVEDNAYPPFEVRRRSLRKISRQVERTGRADIPWMIDTLGLADRVTFLTPEDVVDIMQQDKLGGVGVGIMQTPEGPLIASVVDNSPAALAGLASGDIIASIDGALALEMPIEEARRKLRGEAGERVAIALAGATDRAVELEFEIIETVAIKGRLEGDIGVIEMRSMPTNVTELLSQAVQPARRARAKAFILDLRGSVGGAVTACVNAAGYFLDGATVGQLTGRDGVETFDAPLGDSLHGAPLYVLVDRFTSSGAEMVAAALQSNGRALLVGETTFGRAEIKSIYALRLESGSLGMASYGAIYVRSGEFAGPHGESWRGAGLEPDIKASAETALAVAIRELRAAP